jgi:hypothetical protein
MGWADQRLADLVADYATLNVATFDAGSLTRLLAGLASVGCAARAAAAAGARRARRRPARGGGTSLDAWPSHGRSRLQPCPASPLLSPLGAASPPLPP